MSKPNKIPEFKTEAEERAFWESHDSADYLDWQQAKPVSGPTFKNVPSSILAPDEDS
ncbi:MAG: CopG family antitoxin [Alcanivoracaceae bacterium]